MSNHLLQTAWWGRLKSEFGWNVVIANDRTTRVFLRRLGPVRFAYVPYGFDGRSGELQVIAAVLRTIGDRPDSSAHLVRWDVPWSAAQFDRDLALSLGFRPAPVRVQPPDTVILDLSPDEDTLLAQMKPKTRYNIRLAVKRGVVVSRLLPGDDGSGEALSRWYRIYQETARRDRITIHPERYYRRVIELAREPDAPSIRLFLAHHEDDLLGGVITGSWNGVCTYLYGAGADTKRNYMASYLLQWEAICDAVMRGDRWYDFFGIPPTDDPTHAMHGLYRFKTGFGGAVYRRAGAWDLPVAPVIAGLYRGAEAARRWYHHDFRKRILPRLRGGEYR